MMPDVPEEVDADWPDKAKATRRSEIDQELVARFEELIGLGVHNENELQRFVEENTGFLPTPGLLNHQLHCRCLISKFPVGERKTDFAYLTKSSDRWKLVLVELESPAKKLFKQGDNAANSADFNDAVAQILTWKEHWDDVRQDVLKRLEPIMIPPVMASNALSVEYVLVIGRAAEKKHDDARRRRLATLGEQGIHVMTWDTLLNEYRSGRGHAKAVLTVDGQGYRLKHAERSPKLLFTYIRPKHLKLSRAAEAAVRADGYEIDAWRDGHMLVLNERHPIHDREAFMQEGVRSYLESIAGAVPRTRR